MNAEMMLVCKLIQTGKMREALEFGLSPEDFVTPEANSIFQQLLTIYMNPESSGSVLGPTMAKQAFPHLPWREVDEHVTVDHLCVEVRSGRLAVLLRTAMNGAISKLETRDVRGAAYDLQQAINTYQHVGVTKNFDTPGHAGMARVMETYDRRKMGLEPGVCYWHWSEISKYVGPVYGDDYIVFYGRPKNMKSWMLLVQAASCVFDQDLPTLIYTKEMPVDQVYMRLASIQTGMPYGEMRLGALDPNREEFFRAEMQKMVDRLKAKAERNSLWVLSGKDIPGRDTISWFRSKVEKYRPAVSFIDGLYLMTPENGKLVKPNERLENVSRAARQLILDTNVPLFCTLQANRQASKHEQGELSEIAMSDAVAQDCTAAIRTIKDKQLDTETGQHTCSLVVAGAREWNLSGWRVFAEPSTNFQFKEILDEKEASRVRDTDTQDDKEKKARKAEKPKGADASKIQSVVDKLVAS